MKATAEESFLRQETTTTATAASINSFEDLKSKTDEIDKRFMPFYKKLCLRH